MSDLAARLSDLDDRSLRRRRRPVEGEALGAHVVVDGKPCLAFCSNDYLGLSHHPVLVRAVIDGAHRYGVGAGASHLISGHSTAHASLERALAQFVRLPRALYFSSGYMANLGVVPALVGRGDAVFSDALNHASLVDAARLSRADVTVYPHLDLDALAVALRQSGSPRKLVATDAVFSMDGDLAPLPRIMELCERHEAWLLIDDAHGFGVLGPDGRGTAAHFDLRSPRMIYMGTLGKAAGVAGAFVAAETELVEWLVQRARTYVFSTATPPLLATALLASLCLIESESWRREHLQTLIRKLRDGLRDCPLRLLASQTPIQPLIVGDNRHVVELSERLMTQGIWVPAIRPPTVAAGTARLRISLSAAHSVDDVERLVGSLHALAAA